MLGTMPLLSAMVGARVRTNSESLIGITTFRKQTVFSDVAISSMLHTDEHSHLEPVRYPVGSGFWRLFLLPLAQGKNTSGLDNLFGISSVIRCET